MGKIANVLNKIWPWFQTAYDKLEKLELDPKVKEMLDKVWDNLSPAIQKALADFMVSIWKKYGPEKAKAILDDVIKRIPVIDK